VRFGGKLRKEQGLDFLIEVANQLFSGSVLEEKVAAVFLLEKLDSEFGDREFKLFESWLDRISSWADHDALVHDLIAPMVAAKPARANVFRWAKSAEPLAAERGLRGPDTGSARPRMFFPRSHGFPTRFSRIKMTWCRKD
jgi:hypothetical protein